MSVSTVTPLSDCESGELPRSYGSRDSILSHRNKNNRRRRKEEYERDRERYGTVSGME